MQVTNKEADKYQDLFNLMYKKHKVTLTIDEMNEVISEAKKVSIKSDCLADVTCFVCKKEGATSKEKIYDQCPECLGLGHSGYEVKCGKCKGEGSAWVEVTVHSDCM